MVRMSTGAAKISRANDHVLGNTISCHNIWYNGLFAGHIQKGHQLGLFVFYDAAWHGLQLKTAEYSTTTKIGENSLEENSKYTRNNRDSRENRNSDTFVAAIGSLM